MSDEYTLTMTLRVKGYGSDQQAAATAQRIRQTLATTLHRSINITQLEVERPDETADQTGP